MFEDEMTEEHMARTDAEYQAVTRQEVFVEELAQAKSVASGLIGWATALVLSSQDGGTQ